MRTGKNTEVGAVKPTKVLRFSGKYCRRRMNILTIFFIREVHLVLYFTPSFSLYVSRKFLLDNIGLYSEE